MPSSSLGTPSPDLGAASSDTLYSLVVSAEFLVALGDLGVQSTSNTHWEMRDYPILLILIQVLYVFITHSYPLFY